MLAPSSGGMILYQAYGNLYAMTGRKAHLLEDKQIPVAGDGIASTKRRRCDQSSDGVRILATASRRGRLKEDLELSTWRRRQDCKATSSRRQLYKYKSVFKYKKLDDMQSGVSTTDAVRILEIAPAMANEHLLAGKSKVYYLWQPTTFLDPLNITAMACPALPICPLAKIEAERGILDLLKSNPMDMDTEDKENACPSSAASANSTSKGVSDEQLIYFNQTRMDDPTVNWSRQRYEEIVSKMSPFSNMTFLPISGLRGTNIQTRVKRDVCSWFNGQCLSEALDGIEVAPLNPNGPFSEPLEQDMAICLDEDDLIKQIHKEKELRNVNAGDLDQGRIYSHDRKGFSSHVTEYVKGCAGEEEGILKRSIIKLSAIDGFEFSLPVAICSGVANALVQYYGAFDYHIVFGKLSTINGFEKSLPKLFALD
ncbi:hypothetical protein Tco_0680002 [Tanacetum coccineum]|uniref:Uncharacterized protein n=1 Tax=Tanacetum coccineum TaxID=301880 RepID=A0ABQ4XKF8_9ASTR